MWQRHARHRHSLFSLIPCFISSLYFTCVPACTQRLVSIQRPRRCQRVPEGARECPFEFQTLPGHLCSEKTRQHRSLQAPTDLIHWKQTLTISASRRQQHGSTDQQSTPQKSSRRYYPSLETGSAGKYLFLHSDILPGNRTHNHR